MEEIRQVCTRREAQQAISPIQNDGPIRQLDERAFAAEDKLLSMAASGKSHVQALRVDQELALDWFKTSPRKEDDDGVLFTSLDRVHGMQVDAEVASEVHQDPELFRIEDDDGYRGRSNAVTEWDVTIS